MASAMIHYSISNLLLNELKVQNAVPFLLGAVLGPDASSHEDGTYDRLNYLLIKEFHLKRIDFKEKEITIVDSTISELLKKAEKLLVGEKNFKQWFDAIPCDKEDLDIYTWDVIEQYIKK